MQWLIGGLVVFGVGFGGASITAYIAVVQRLTKIETTIELLGINAAKALHCPTTPDMDMLLEKYYERHFELSFEEWSAMLAFYQNILDDQSQARAYRLAAGQLVAVCHHKLKHDPPKFRKIV